MNKKIHIFKRNSDGSKGAEFSFFDPSNIFITRKFSEHRRDFQFKDVVTSLTIKFSAINNNALITNLITQKKTDIIVYVDDVFLFKGSLDVKTVTWGDYEGTFVKTVNASLVEENDFFTMMGLTPEDYNYQFPADRTETIPTKTFFEWFIAKAGYTSLSIPQYTIVPQIKSISITVIVPYQEWTGGYYVIDQWFRPKSQETSYSSYSGNNNTLWTLKPTATGMTNWDLFTNNTSIKFTWRSSELGDTGENNAIVGYVDQTTIDSIYLYEWRYPEWTMPYSFLINKNNFFTLGDAAHKYTFGVTNITYLEPHTWTWSRHVGESNDIGIDFTTQSNIAVETKGMLCRKEELDSSGVTGFKYTIPILWIAAIDNGTTHPPEPTGTANITRVRRKTNFSTPGWGNGMRDKKMVALFEIFCREAGVHLVLNNQAKTVSYVNNDAILNVTVFSTPITFEWKKATIKYDITSEPFYLNEVLPTAPDQIAVDEDYYYYTITVQTIISPEDFVRVKNNQKVKFVLGNETISNYIISEIKNWRPETGLCTIVAYDNSIAPTAYDRQQKVASAIRAIPTRTEGTDTGKV